MVSEVGQDDGGEKQGEDGERHQPGHQPPPPASHCRNTIKLFDLSPDPNCPLCHPVRLPVFPRSGPGGAGPSISQLRGKEARLAFTAAPAGRTAELGRGRRWDSPLVITRHTLETEDQQG